MTKAEKKRKEWLEYMIDRRGKGTLKRLSELIHLQAKEEEEKSK